MLYLIGSLRNPEIPKIGNAIRAVGVDVFDDWFAAGPIADDSWQEYEIGRGHSFGEALQGFAARHVFDFDMRHLNRADGAILVLPAGKSGHLEFGYTIGQGKKGYVLFDKQPERYDIMYQFASGVYFHLDDLITGLTR